VNDPAQQHPGFYHLGIAPKMLQVLEHLKFSSPTPVQRSAIPLAIEGQDVIAVAQTGTGKTLAFGIPMVQILAHSGGHALVLAPTRDLALQIEEVFKTILHPFRMNGVVLIGGMPMGRQVQQLSRRPQVIIATPGRLNDHIDHRTVHLEKVGLLVIDEADRMLDMGFAPQVERILQVLPKKRQTLIFSATMLADIVKIAARHMKTPVHVEITPSGKTAQDVTQELFIVKEENKKKLLHALLGKYRGSVLLFIRTKAKTRKIARYLNEMGHKAVEIHSNRSMGQRKEAIEGFKSGRYRVLAATDVAARGIDIKNIELVINFDLPDDAENYVHRIGRTGRAGQAGHAITFAAPDQGRDIRNIETLIKTSIAIGAHEGFAAERFEGHPSPAARPGRSAGRSGRRFSGRGPSRFRGRRR